MYAIRSYYEGYNTLVYTTPEIRRIGQVAFDLAMKRGKKVTSVDKANVLESTILWREEMEVVAVITSYSIHYTKLYE